MGKWEESAGTYRENDRGSVPQMSGDDLSSWYQTWDLTLYFLSSHFCLIFLTPGPGSDEGCCSLTDARAIFDLRRSVNCGALETEASSWLIHVIEPYCSSSSWIASLHFLLLIRSLQWCHCGGDITATLNGCVHFVRMMWMWLQCDPLTLYVNYTYYLVFYHQYRMSVTVSAVTLSYFYIT